MKMRIVLLSLFVSLLLLSTNSVLAAGSGTSLQTRHIESRVDSGSSDLEVIGANDDDGHTDDEDAHSEEVAAENHGDDGHSSDDDHHSDQPFTWRTLIPLYAGIVGAVVAVVLAKIILSAVAPLDMGIISLTTLVGVLHLVIGLAGDKLLLLNGLGFLALLVLLYLPIDFLKKLLTPLRFALGLYTLLTIAGYFFLHSPDQYDVLAIVSKIIEAILVALVIGSLFQRPGKQFGTD